MQLGNKIFRMTSRDYQLWCVGKYDVLTKGSNMKPESLGEELIEKERIWSWFYLELFYIWRYFIIPKRKDNTYNFSEQKKNWGWTENLGMFVFCRKKTWNRKCSQLESFSTSMSPCCGFNYQVFLTIFHTSSMVIFTMYSWLTLFTSSIFANSPTC